MIPAEYLDDNPVPIQLKMFDEDIGKDDFIGEC